MRRWIIAFACGGLMTAAAAIAQDKYPTRPIRIVVPQSAGGSTDLVARLAAQKLGEAFGQTVVVDNRPGAGSIIGTDLVAKAAPDGYTLLVVASSITINLSLHKKLPFDPVLHVLLYTIQFLPIRIFFGLLFFTFLRNQGYVKYQWVHS